MKPRIVPGDERGEERTLSRSKVVHYTQTVGEETIDIEITTTIREASEGPVVQEIEGPGGFARIRGQAVPIITNVKCVVSIEDAGAKQELHLNGETLLNLIHMVSRVLPSELNANPMFYAP